METIQELTSRWSEIRDEVIENQNSAERVGIAGLKTINYLDGMETRLSDLEESQSGGDVLPSDNYIPLSGTKPGKRVMGDIEMSNDTGLVSPTGKRIGFDANGNPINTITDLGKISIGVIDNILDGDYIFKVQEGGALAAYRLFQVTRDYSGTILKYQSRFTTNSNLLEGRNRPPSGVWSSWEKIGGSNSIQIPTIANLVDDRDLNQIWFTINGHYDEINTLKPEICLVWRRKGSRDTTVGKNGSPSRRKHKIALVREWDDRDYNVTNPHKNIIPFFQYPINPDMRNNLYSRADTGRGHALSAKDLIKPQVFEGPDYIKWSKSRVQLSLDNGGSKAIMQRFGLCVRIRNPKYAAAGGVYHNNWGTNMMGQIYYNGIPAYLYGEITPIILAMTKLDGHIVNPITGKQVVVYTIAMRV